MLPKNVKWLIFILFYFVFGFNVYEDSALFLRADLLRNMYYDDVEDEVFYLWAQSLDYTGHFKLPSKYDTEDIRSFEYGWGLIVSANVLQVLIDQDIFLREAAQRIQQYEFDILRLEKESEYSNNVVDSLKSVQNEQEEVKALIMRAEENIYAAELLLPEKPLRKVYRKIRENPAWYLRPELVQDCIARGGCCGRDCRCCESRHINHNTKGKWKPGAGHCTVECHCCCKNRGFSLEGDERQEVSDRLRKRLSSRNPSYLLALSESYFCMPGRFAFGKPSIIEFLAWVCYYGPGFSKWRTIRNWRKIPEKMNEK